MTRPGAALLAASIFAFVSTASAAPVASPAGPPPTPADPSQPEPDEPAPADPLATPTEPAASPAKKPEPQLAESDTLVVRAGLDIDTAEAGPSGPVIVSRMEELGNLELRRAEILPSRLGNDPVIRIRVSLQSGASDVFLIRSDVAVRGEVVEGSARDVMCSLCTESEVVERARGEIVRLVPFVRSLFKKPEEPKPTPVAPPPREPDRSLGTMGKAGIGLLAGGVVATATGLGLSLAEEPADADMPLNKITLHPVGYAVLGVGVAALITGAVLLGVDRRRASRRTVQVAPTAAPGTAGLILVGRF